MLLSLPSPSFGIVTALPKINSLTRNGFTGLCQRRRLQITESQISITVPIRIVKVRESDVFVRWRETCEKLTDKPKKKTNIQYHWTVMIIIRVLKKNARKNNESHTLHNIIHVFFSAPFIPFLFFVLFSPNSSLFVCHHFTLDFFLAKKKIFRRRALIYSWFFRMAFVGVECVWYFTDFTIVIYPTPSIQYSVPRKQMSNI